MAKVKIKSNLRTNQTVVYYGGEYTFVDGITEVDESKVEKMLNIHDDLSIYIEDKEKELLLQNIKDNIDKQILIHGSPNVEELKDITQGAFKVPEDLKAKEEVKEPTDKAEEKSEEPVKKEPTYEETLLAMERKDLVDLAIEAGFEDKELKPLSKTKLVAKILTKI